MSKSNKDENIDKEDISCIFFTSGSSGKPKGVELTYYNVISCAKYQIKNLNYKSNQIFADCHDTGFVMSLVVIFPAIILKGTFSPLISLSDKLSPIDYFIENRINNLITVPSFKTKKPDPEPAGTILLSSGLVLGFSFFGFSFFGFVTILGVLCFFMTSSPALSTVIVLDL